MSGYNISVEDRLRQKPSLKKKKRKRPSDTPKDSIEVSHRTVIKRGLPESKYACVRKPLEKQEAADQLWGLQKHSGESRWVMEECLKCRAWHIIRLRW